MSDGVPYGDILIMALLAGLVLLRLRSVLGSRDGFEGDFTAPRPAAEEPIVQVDEKSLKRPREDDTYMASLSDDALLKTLSDLKSRDPQFSATDFLRGARAAFEMVFDAFVKGDRPTLKRLLAEPIYQDFAAEIDRRQAASEKSETTLISAAARGIVAAAVEKNLARLTVHFVSEQVTVTRGANGDIVQGDPSDIQEVEDRWVFEREVGSKNPNWKIIET